MSHMRSGFPYQDETHTVGLLKVKWNRLTYVLLSAIIFFYSLGTNTLSILACSDRFGSVLVICAYGSWSDMCVSFAGKQEIGYLILWTGLSGCLGKVNMGTLITSSSLEKSWPTEITGMCRLEPSLSPASAIWNWHQGFQLFLSPQSLGGIQSCPLHSHSPHCGAKKGFEQHFESG